MGQPLYCSAAGADVWPERRYGYGSTPCSWLSSIASLLCCLAFHHRHFSPQCLPSYPLDLSLHSQQQPSLWDCSTISKFQLPAAAPSRGPVSLSAVCMDAARTVWFSFHLGCHRSAVSLSALNISPLTQTTAPHVGIGPLLQFLHPPRGRSSPTNTPVFLPSSYQVLHGSIYSSPLVRYSCPLSAGVMHAFLCLKVYSWCIRGERCTSRPPTPLPSCSIFFELWSISSPRMWEEAAWLLGLLF